MTSEDGRLFSRAVRETLDTVVAPLVRDALIHDALALAGLDELPENAGAVRAFATGPLRRIAERALGAELAQSVAEEILLTIQVEPDRAPWSEPPGVVRHQTPTPRNPRASAASMRRSMTPAPMARRSSIPPPAPGRSRGTAPPMPYRSMTPVPFGFRRAITPVVGSVREAAWPSGMGSHIRANTRADGSAASPSAPPAGMVTPSGPVVRTAAFDAPLVLVATEDSALFQTLAEWFGNRARVCRVRNPVDLVQHFGSAGGKRAVVVLDGKSPSVRPAALSVLLEDQPSFEVVVCRASPALEEVVLANGGTGRWLVYREPASLDHVAAECVRLVS